MKAFRALVIGLALSAIACPVFAQDEAPRCGTTGSVLWFWKKPTPHVIDRAVQMWGLREGEFIGAIDFDVGSGVLYGAGSHGGFYQIDTDSGFASFMGSVGFDIDFPCGNDLKWRHKLCPGCPPPPGPLHWDFVLQGGVIMETTIDPAGGVGFAINPPLAFPASSAHAGVTPFVTGLAAVPSAARDGEWAIYAYDRATCGLYKVDEFADMLLDIDLGLQPGCWPPDGGVLRGMDAVLGPKPNPWLDFLFPMDPLASSTMYATFDLDEPGAQMTLRGLVAGGELSFYDMTVLASDTACPADLNGDGLIDFADYLEFLNLFDSQDPRADFNGDGLVDFADYLEFLNHYDAGC